jgi:two-component system phosphate regulon response regulator PhoB
VADAAEREPDLPRTLIVVADANARDLAGLSAGLEQRGYEVAQAPDGQQALELIRDRGPAAAVLDWVMPVMQGPAVCAEIKSDPRTARIPVVLLTTRAAEEDIARAFAQGVDDYVTKPFAIDELDDILRSLISAR